jgi:HPt (histidine-containing phosphotransfer) domain-containing protein
MPSRYVKLTNVEQIARGDQAKYLKYLKQFEELVEQRVVDLKQAVADKDRQLVIRVVHGMKPQVLFFEVTDAAQPMNAIEMQGLEMLWEEMNSYCLALIERLELAVTEIKSVISSQA